MQSAIINDLKQRVETLERNTGALPGPSASAASAGVGGSSDGSGVGDAAMKAAQHLSGQLLEAVTALKAVMKQVWHWEAVVFFCEMLGCPPNCIASTNPMCAPL